MSDRTATWLGDSVVHLEGPKLAAGDAAPEVVLQRRFGGDVRLLAHTAGKIRLVSAVPSLDTAVCDEQTRRLSTEFEALGEEFALLTVSADLPPAQDRWCREAGVPRDSVLSDHREMAFARAYGTLIREYRLEHRALFVIDDEDVIRYVEYLDEVHEHPDYESALGALKGLA